MKSICTDPKKEYILLDYVYGCQTKKALETLIENNTELSKINFKFLPLPSCLKEHTESSSHVLTQEEENRLEYVMKRSLISYLSNVPHFNINNNKTNSGKTYIRYNGSIKKFKIKTSAYSQPYAKAYSICAFNEIDKMLKE